MSPKPLLAAVVVLVLGVVAWLLLPGDEPPAVVGENTNTIAAPEPSPNVGTVVNDASATEATMRTAATTDTPAPPPSLSAMLPVLVIDLLGEPVAGAAVSVSDPVVNGRRSAGRPRERVTTNAAGRARVTIASACSVSAQHAGVGSSGDMHVWPASMMLPDELRLVLLPMATIRGRVLLADGSPAAGAAVHFQCGVRQGEPSWTLSPLTADADGRFSVQVRIGAGYALWARLRSLGTEDLWVNALVAGEVRDVTLTFRGGFSVRGLVLDGGRQPVRANVRLRDLGNPRDIGQLLPGNCEGDGRFDVPLARAGRYHVMAALHGHAVALAEVAVDAASPHAQVTLALSPLAIVTGQVVDERREPCSGVKVFLDDIPEAGADGVQVAMTKSMQENVRDTVTDANGGFRFEAPSAARYRVGVQAIANNSWLHVHSAEFTAPAAGLTIAVRAADKQGFELAGNVVAAGSGARVDDIRIGLCVPDAKSDTVGLGGDGTFRVGPFGVGSRYLFEIEALGFAPSLVGPFDATMRCEHVSVQLHQWATVRCRVLRADGAPAANALVRLERDPPAAWSSRTWQGETDADGRLTFHHVVPAPHRLLAQPTRHAGDAPGVAVVAAPGETSDVQVVFGR